MLGIDPAGEHTTATRGSGGTEEERHRTTRRRQADGSQNERKMPTAEAFLTSNPLASAQAYEIVTHAQQATRNDRVTERRRQRGNRLRVVVILGC
jgi:hypothetical protein